MFTGKDQLYDCAAAHMIFFSLVAILLDDLNLLSLCECFWTIYTGVTITSFATFFAYNTDTFDNSVVS